METGWLVFVIAIMLVRFSQLKKLELSELCLLGGDAWWRLGGWRVLPVRRVIVKLWLGSINPANGAGQNGVLVAERARHCRQVKRQRRSVAEFKLRWWERAAP